MTLLPADQIRAWDSFTIQNEPISSYNLMERASSVFTDWFSMIYDTQRPLLIFCGTGNNGGDGLAIARFLYYLRYDVSVYICRISKNETADFVKNLVKIQDLEASILRGYILEEDAFPPIPNNAIFIDAILGSGLTRPVTGYWASFFDYLNQSKAEIVSVDIPSGLSSDKHTEEGSVLNATRVLSFEIPKLSIFRH